VSEHSAKPTWEGRVFCTQREIIKTISPPQVVEIGDACSQAEAVAATNAFSKHLLHFVIHPALTAESERGAGNRLRPRKNAAAEELDTSVLYFSSCQSPHSRSVYFFLQVLSVDDDTFKVTIICVSCVAEEALTWMFCCRRCSL
jgi:hypothetical protein